MFKIFSIVPILSITTLCYSQSVKNIGSMSEMGNENFAPHIKLDTINNKKHLFGMGPYGKMQGEITVFDGKPFYSSVNENGIGIVSANWGIESPFFVYSNVDKWQEFTINIALNSVEDIQEIVKEIAQKNGYDLNNPFPFRVTGTFDNITTHIVMPRSADIKGYQEGKKQANYNLTKQTGELLGFYSEKHQGVYTPKNGFVHVHFISDDLTLMSHLDKITQPKSKLKLLLPIRTKK